MSATVLERSVAKPSATFALLPIMAVVFIGFLIIGVALPVLPLHVHQGLGLSTFVVGLIAGSQFLASLISRVWSGHYADSRGAKRAVIVGLAAATCGGMLYLASLHFDETPSVAATILLIGRGLLGVAESFIITGGVSLDLALAGPSNAGKVIAWVGMAMFAGLAFGAPVGTTVYAFGGFVSIATATILLPLVTLLLVMPLASIPLHKGRRPNVLTVARAVWLPGLGSALSCIGFGTMIAFSSLLASERNWTPVWLLFSAFALSLTITRPFFGHMPDRLGGARVALGTVLIEAIGLAVIWLAPVQIIAAAGAVLTGAGFALVYPGLGVEAVRRTPPEIRGLAIGAYTAFLDVALGFGSPALGLIANWAGLSSVYLAGALLVLGAAIISIRLLCPPSYEASPR